MQQLFPLSDSPTNVDVHEFFGRDWLESGGLRANFVASTDGAISVSGKSRGLQTPGDNLVFAALRDLADVVLIGAGTARVEGYTALNQSAARARRREAAGLAPVLPISLVSRSLGLDPTSALFTGAAEGARTIVFTCAAAEPAEHSELARVADIVVCGDDEVDLSQVHDALLGARAPPDPVRGRTHPVRRPGSHVRRSASSA